MGLVWFSGLEGFRVDPRGLRGGLEGFSGLEGI